MLKILLRVIAVPVLVLFVLALPISLMLRDVGSLLFEADTTKALVRQSLLGSDLAGRFARRSTEQVLSSDTGGEAGFTLLFTQIDEEEWRQITEIIAPEDLIAETVDVIVDAFTNWLNDDQADFPELQVNLSRLKANAIQNTEEVVAVFLNALPECSADVLSNLTLDAGLLESFPGCRPPEPLYSQIVAQADSSVGQLISQAPDNIDLNQITDCQQAPAELIQLKQTLVRLRLGLAWGWVAVLGIGLLAAWAASAGLKSFLRWSGWPMLLAGGLTLILGLSLFVFTFSFMDRALAMIFGDESAAMGVLASAMAGGALNLVSGPLALQGLVATMAGLGALLYARSQHQREKSPGIPINRKRISL